MVNFFSLLYMVIVKICLTIVTYGSSVPCGIFVPSIAIGAGFGRIIGLIMEAIYENNKAFGLFSSCPMDGPCVVPGMYSVIGAASVLSGVTRMTVTTAVVMFEITGDLSNILPIVISLMISKFFGDWLNPDSISEGLIKLKGFPYLSQTQEYHLFSTAWSTMTNVSDLCVIPEKRLSLSAIDALLEQGFSGFPIVKSDIDMILLGYISADELKYAVQKAKMDRRHCDAELICCFISDNPGREYINFSPYTDKCPLVVSEKISSEVVIEMFRKLGLRYLIVADQGILKGLITKKDILRVINNSRRSN